MSPIDKIFLEIFGYVPKKSGTAYEMLSCIAEHLMNEGEIKHDRKIRGEFSKTLYQIDVLSKTEDGKSMGEAKDYTTRNKKVGRGDIQKLSGALPDLPDVSKGKFFSATGYTAPAKKYAAANSDFPDGKPIEIFEFRPSTEKDEEGTIKTVCIDMHFLIPHPRQGKWIPHVTEQGKECCKSLVKEGEKEFNYSLRLENFYDDQGNKKLSLFELTSQDYGAINSDTKSAHGCFLLPKHYLQIENVLVELKGLEYEIPYTETHQKMEITNDSNCRFVVKDAEGALVRFVTDQQIQTYSFDEEGNLIKP